MPRLRTLLVLVVALLLAACVPPYQVVNRAVPNPFSHQRRFRVLPVSFEGAELVARENPLHPDKEQARAELDAGLAAMRRQFFETLVRRMAGTDVELVAADTPDLAAFTIAPTAQFVDSGMFAQRDLGNVKEWYRIQSSTRMSVRILAPGGAQFDEIVVRYQSPGLINTTWRLGNDGLACAVAAAEHLKERVKGD